MDMKGLEEIKEKVTNVNNYSVMIGRGNSFAKGLGMIDELISDIEEYVNQVEQPALPVIPKFVAEWIEKNKGSNYNVRDSLMNVTSEINEWLFEDENMNDYIRAWLDGYTVEEKKYKVNVEGLIILAKACEECNIHAYNDLIEYDEAYIKELTEKEIKDYDERYFAFAVPVEE